MEAKVQNKKKAAPAKVTLIGGKPYFLRGSQWHPIEEFDKPGDNRR